MKEPSFYRHKMEKPLFVIAFIISLAIFILLSYLGFMATIGSEENNLILQILQIESSFAKYVMKIGGYISIVIIIFFFVTVLVLSEKEINIKATARDVHITNKQFAVLMKTEEEYDMGKFV